MSISVISTRRILVEEEGCEIIEVGATIKVEISESVIFGVLKEIDEDTIDVEIDKALVEITIDIDDIDKIEEV